VDQVISSVTHAVGEYAAKQLPGHQPTP